MPSQRMSVFQDVLNRFRNRPSAIAAAAGGIGLVCGALAMAMTRSRRRWHRAPSAAVQVPSQGQVAAKPLVERPVSATGGPARYPDRRARDGGNADIRLRRASLAVHHAGMPGETSRRTQPRSYHHDGSHYFTGARVGEPNRSRALAASMHRDKTADARRRDCGCRSARRDDSGRTVPLPLPPPGCSERETGE